jgi:hypothetical protein
MKYVNVATKSFKNSLEYDQAVLRQSGHCLYSLIEGLRQKDFGLHTLSGVMKNINEYRAKCVTPVGGHLFADSGGYSIIRGDVHPNEISRFIQCYNYYLANQSDKFEYIFSLDVPLFLKYPRFNARTLVYEYNRQSLLDAKKIMESRQEIQNKFYFIWQFKLLDQYAIWNQLYKELELGKLIRNHALGGMVGLRKLVKIDYSPFIPMAYKCLSEWEAGGLCGEFRLHFLGMYLGYDRFQIALLEQLFRHYLAGAHSVTMSYDSINFAHVMRLNKDLPFFSWDGVDLGVYPKPKDVPGGIVTDIYNTPFLQEAFDEAVKARTTGNGRLKNTNTFVPLNIYSNKHLDAFYEDLISSTGLVGMFVGQRSHTKFWNHTNGLLGIWANTYPEVFTPWVVKSIRKNLDITFMMHFWKENDGRPCELERLALKAIQILGVPIKLA